MLNLFFFGRVSSNLKELFSFQQNNDDLPILESADPVDRDIDFVPTKSPYDPRWMLAGRYDPEDETKRKWQTGFFDKYSFNEIMSAWAQTIVAGRAR